ncbi:FAD-dependent oxidoreductase [Calderihabitans maritimus]|uniref:CoA-disulfide reductase n=1 Tax=Calderihabitans maritimus TaxID=1246530 RepID=A0A1Z5HQW8_9FIRM|nr:FAD-dependent oxidoreductase [Calderihabitans maritimus]GAW91767.1 CoA-disulfide reductase [Calderihabitans maritimus]
MQGRKRIVIIGGVATGPKVAARARRLMPEADITVVERGRLISYGACGLPLFLAGMVGEVSELTATPSGINRDVEYFAKEKNIKFLTRTLAKYIDRAKKEVIIYDLERNEENSIQYDELVLATGAEPVIPPVPGTNLEGVLTLHHPDDAVAIRAALEAGAQNIVIIGGGLVGLEAADALVGPKRKITVIEMKEHLLAGALDPEIAQLVRDQVEMHGVSVRTGERLVALEGDDESRVTKVITERTSLQADLVILACGVKPNVELARECGLAIGNTGAISVNEFLLTSDPHIYAAGDCIENRHLVTGEPVYVPLASTANKQGRVIGSNLAGYRERYPGILGTTVMQIFDYNVGRTGLTETEAREKGYPVTKALVAGLDSAHYHPMHAGGIIKVVAHAETGKVLGAQVVGPGEVIKRLDVLVTAIQLGANIDQIAKLDLGYAPPFATAIDLGISAANTLKNKTQGLAQGIGPIEFVEMLNSQEQFVILDVRTPEEADDRPLADDRVVHIPLYELRQRIGELPKERKIITLCELGVRAYEAVRILKGEKFNDVVFLEGGVFALPASLVKKP